MVALPPSPCILTRVAMRCLLESSIVPSESQLAARTGGEKGKQYLLPASKHICAHEWIEGCSDVTAADSM